MENYFPVDVSLRVEGDDLESAQSMFPAAKQLLYRALRRQSLGGVPNVTMFQPGTDGSLVGVVLAGNLKQVYVTPAPRSATSKSTPEEPKPVDDFYFFPYAMWSGVARPTSPETRPQVITITNPDPPPDGIVPALDQFHPDAVTSSAYAIAFDWQQPHKLGVNSGGTGSTGPAACSFPKPGNYSGAMKRVVQAVLGIGNTETDTEEYISGELPATAPDLAVWNQYDYTWLRTHGIHKADDGSIWLIEVSKLNGVCAMPLPIFKGTDSYQFMAWINQAGDTDTLNILLEFGGLPSGEKFPTSTDLADAITAGKVLQLLSASDVLPFYRDTVYSVDKNGVFPNCGWAFSESGKLSDNVCAWYKDGNMVLNRSVWGVDGRNSDPTDIRYPMTQHWNLSLELSATPTETSSIGSGVAVLSLVQESPFITNSYIETGSTFPELYACDMIRVPGGDGEGLANAHFFGRPTKPGGDVASVPPPVVHVFYVGETLERVIGVFPGAASTQYVSFVGNSLDLGIPPLTPHTSCVGLAIPAFCREGYLLIKGDLSSTPSPTTYSTFPITVGGYFAQLGAVVFPTITELFYSTKLFGIAYQMATWPAYWLTQGNSLTTFSGPINMYFGLSINAGPTIGYVMNNGIAVDDNSVNDFVGGGNVVRPATSGYLQPSSIADLAVPISTPAEQVTFVGSV